MTDNSPAQEKGPMTATALTRREKVKVVASAVEAELASAWVRKGSFEVRAFSLVTANLATVTLFFVLQTQLGYEAYKHDGIVRLLIVVGLIVIAVSITLAAVSAMPRDYPAMESGGFARFLEEASSDVDVDLEVEFAEYRISQYERTLRSNKSKGSLVLAAFAVLFAGIVLLALALGLASLA